jgi:acetolactate synthase I/II/III large subunit
MFGVIESYLASSPMVVLSELSDADGFVVHGPIQSGAGHYGSFDLASMFRASTKYTAVAHYPREAVISVQLALKHATAGRPGPTACLFRSNVLGEPVADNGLPEIHDTARLVAAAKTRPPDAALDAAAAILREAEAPVIVAGNVAETHELAAGPIGYTGLPLANDTLGMADAILVVGCRLKPQETCFEHPRMIDPSRQRIVHIDVEPRNVSWTIPAEVALVGDADLTLRLLHERLANRIDGAAVAARRKAFVAIKAARNYFAHPMQASENVPVAPQRLVAEVQRAVPEEAIVCSDAGNNRHWMNHFFQTRRANSYFGTGGLGGAIWVMQPILPAATIVGRSPRCSHLAVAQRADLGLHDVVGAGRAAAEMPSAAP